MKQERYYYIRDNIKSDPQGLGRPIITVCLIEEGGIIARGIAVCSNLDQPCKKTGRTIAKTRASFALSSGRDGLELKRHGLPLDAFELGFQKSYFDPCLTEHERKLLRITGNHTPGNLPF